MPRGGVRIGAGRPTALDSIEIMMVAAEYSTRWAAEVELRTAPTLPDEFRLLTDRVRSVPVEDRLGFARRATFEAQDYFDDLDSETNDRAAKLGTTQRRARYFSKPASVRPYGVKKKLEQEVAAWATDLLGKPVSARRVRACHELICAAQADSF